MIHPTKIAKELFPLNEDETDPGTVFDWRRRTAQAIEIDRKQRQSVLTVPAEGLRIGVFGPADAYRVISDLLETGYELEQIEWEV